MEELVRVLAEAESVAVLTGAGVSAESGIPTFRGKDGLWNKYDPIELAVPEAFEREPAKVWKWYLWRMKLVSDAQPNPGHLAIAEMENLFPSFLLITQNVDNLHRRAGSRKLVELHGNILEGRCRSCGKRYRGHELSLAFPAVNRIKDLEMEEFKRKVVESLTEEDLPECWVCGAPVGPGVVWFGESLPEDALSEAFRACENCDVFFTVGTSAVVQPASSLPLLAKRNGAVLVEVNPEETPVSGYCDFTFRESSSEVLPRLLRALKEHRKNV